MITVLYIARYQHATQHRKVHLLAQQPDLNLWYLHPCGSPDDTSQGAGLPGRALAMLGSPADPHRALYRSLTFSMLRVRPHLIYAEEEPDSLTALQIVLARRLCAPRARLLLYSWQNVNRRKAWYVRLVLRRTLRASDGVLCASRAAAEVLRQQGYPRPVPVLPAIGVDTRVFWPAEPPPAAPQPFVVGYVGRLVPEKGLDTLVASFGLLVRRLHSAGSSQQVRLLLVGSGPLRAVVQSLVYSAQLGDQVDFVPAQPPAEVARQMRGLHALVLPSRSTPVWQEQFGRVLAEAMACRVPVVGAASGAIPDVIGSAGLTFAEGSAAGLADCLQRLIESPALRMACSQRGYARAMQLYTQERIAGYTAVWFRWICTPDISPPPTFSW